MDFEWGALVINRMKPPEYKKDFYFIRHGKTNFNTSIHKIDHEDVSLNAEGLQQARDIEPLITSLPIKTVCSSPLKRAKETKEIISMRLQAPHVEILRAWRVFSSDMESHDRT
jgi:broad specificity phosphatase PhoE